MSENAKTETEERYWFSPHMKGDCPGIVPGKEYDQTMCRLCWLRANNTDRRISLPEKDHRNFNIEIIKEELNHIGVVAVAHKDYIVNHKDWVCEALRSVNEQYYFNVINKVFVYDGTPLPVEIRTELSKGNWSILECRSPSRLAADKRNAGLKFLFQDVNKFKDILFVTFLDCDNFYSPNFFYQAAKLVRREDSNRNIGVIIPTKIIFKDNEIKFSDISSNRYEFIGRIKSSFLSNADHHVPCDLKRYMAVDTCCLWNPIAIFQAGLWKNEAPFQINEDNYLLYRIKKLGYDVVKSFELIFFYRKHDTSVTLSSIEKFKEYNLTSLFPFSNIYPLQVLTIFNKEYCFDAWLDCFCRLQFPPWVVFHWVSSGQDKIFYRKLLKAAANTSYFINLHVLEPDIFMGWSDDLERKYAVDKYKLHRVNGIYNYCFKNMIDSGFCLIYEDDCLIYDRLAVLKLYDTLIENHDFICVGAPIGKFDNHLCGIGNMNELKKVNDYIYEIMPQSLGAPGAFVLYDGSFLKAHLPITTPSSGWDRYYGQIAKSMGFRLGLRMDIVTEHFLRPDLCVRFENMKVFKVGKHYQCI
jgi:hypothetical protein